MLLLIAGSVTATAFLFILHFFGLRLRQKLEFSHIQFLAALNAQTRSARKINNLLLLLLRVLFILSALAAFILFFFSNKNTAAVSSSSSPEVVIDPSWSMQGRAKGQETSKAAQAQKDAGDLLATQQWNKAGQPSQNGGAAPLANGSAPATFLGKEALMNKIESSGTAGGTFIFSDFQKKDFSKEELDALAKKKNVTLIAYPSEAPNFFIDSVWLDQPIINPNSTVVLWARVAGSLQQENNQVSVQVKEGNSLIGTTQVLLEPGQKRMVNFPLKLDSKEAKKLVLEVDDPVNPFDNRYFVVVPKPFVVPVKVSPALSKGHPVLQAYKEEPAFDFTSGKAKSNGLWILEESNLATSNALVQEVKRWLAEGNSLLVMPNEGKQQPLISFLGSIGLTGVREAALEEGEKDLRQPDMSDAFYGGIFEKKVRNLKMPTADPVLTWRSAYHTILRFKDNTPFLSTFKIGEGEVHLFAAPLQKASAFTSHPLFVPVLYQLALQATPSIELAHQPEDGNVLIELPQLIEGQEPYQLKNEAQIYIPQQRVAQNTLQMILPEEVSQPGFYEVVKGETVLEQVALNIPRSQSLLESYTPEELKQQMQERGSQIQVVEPDGRVSLQKQLQNESSTSSLWKYCLILCLLCLLVEAVVISAKKRGSLI